MDFFVIAFVDEAEPCGACGIAIGAHEHPEPIMLPDPEEEGVMMIWNVSCLPNAMRIPLQCRRQWMWN